jgi:hypothetical protein
MPLPVEAVPVVTDQMFPVKTRAVVQVLKHH